jgi:hypothetical protein
VQVGVVGDQLVRLAAVTGALLHDRRKEPWGQTVARLQSQEGSIIGISFAPPLHD